MSNPFEGLHLTRYVCFLFDSVSSDAVDSVVEGLLKQRRTLKIIKIRTNRNFGLCQCTITSCCTEHKRK